ncbi:general transcription factor 3C polypeptide 5 [Sceloporus undulatus]|uniref:general transcription factor 3C polypeptide 5 n=1 Tax=Sceloporus undulatus TaxID=8520 RepID=UPI001C4D8A15|nr:general transcription factor 3C polypeptide 5 [Sceloporus undulatus]XP_042336369.1 general transcription factor 3C polypeptide 5 [Sceloporus undulatus]
MATGSGCAASPPSSSSETGDGGAIGAPGTATPKLERDRRLVCVEYPGVVRSAEKMLLTLGGEEGVSRIYADPSRRLELYFRPKDPYCHPVCANRFPTSSMMFKVKKKTRRRQTGAGDWEEEIKFDVEILGIVTTVYKFQGMSDFQYLAVHSGPSGKQVSMYDKVLMLKPEKDDFFMSDLPLYIPPPIFSRLDTPVDYHYRPEAQHREGYHNPPLSSENLIGLSRARRPHNAIFVNFEDEEIPTKPLDAAEQTWKRVCSKAVDHRAEEELKKLFEVRPVWSRNAVKANISVHPDKLKFLLPYLAYYMLTGPWRSLWVRFGYDPRKHPEAKIYQVLDFRIRCGMKYGYAPNDMPVKAKRSTYNYSLPITLKKPASHAAGIQDLKQGLSSSGTAAARKTAFSKYKLKDSIYIFREGSLPPYRQMFYQLCDLNVECLQKIIHRNDGTEASCTERDGWCLPKTSDDLRDTMSLMIKQIIRSKRPALFTSTSTEEAGKEQLTFESGEEEEEEEEEEFKPSDGSENEMETEILDYV